MHKQKHYRDKHLVVSKQSSAKRKELGLAAVSTWLSKESATGGGRRMDRWHWECRSVVGRELVPELWTYAAESWVVHRAGPGCFRRLSSLLAAGSSVPNQSESTVGRGGEAPEVAFCLLATPLRRWERALHLCLQTPDSGVE